MEYLYHFFLLALLGLGGTAAGSVKIIRQGNQALVETLGKYDGKKLNPGLTFLTPFLDQVVYQASLREQILEIPPKQCITRDRFSISVDIVIYWRITNIEKAFYKVQDLKGAMLNVVETMIRCEIAKLDMQEVLTARSKINHVLVGELDIATEPWGVKVTRVELRDLILGNQVVREGIPPRSVPNQLPVR